MVAETLFLHQKFDKIVIPNLLHRIIQLLWSTAWSKMEADFHLSLKLDISQFALTTRC